MSTFRDQHSERLFDAVRTEIDAERAAALGRVGRRVEAVVIRCQELLARLDGHDDEHGANQHGTHCTATAQHETRRRQRAGSGTGQAHALALLDAYRAARAEFDTAMYAYLVQREAIGLVDHRAVHRAYPRPPRR